MGCILLWPLCPSPHDKMFRQKRLFYKSVHPGNLKSWVLSTSITFSNTPICLHHLLVFFSWGCLMQAKVGESGPVQFCRILAPARPCCPKSQNYYDCRVKRARVCRLVVEQLPSNQKAGWGLLILPLAKCRHPTVLPRSMAVALAVLNLQRKPAKVGISLAKRRFSW